VQYEVAINGALKQVTVVRRDGGFAVTLGGRQWVVDAAQVEGHTLSLLLADASNGVATGGAVSSREITIATDPLTGQFIFGVGPVPLPVNLNARRTWDRRDDGTGGNSGPQRLVAPMPGKVVRVLAAPGDSVAQRQPVIVIEAMKMENELRASRDGTLTEVLVQEGQSVEAGMLLAIITPA
jgi:biotin carboxyl carrier protein